MDLKNYDGVVWIQLAHDRFQRYAAVNTLIKLGVPWGGGFDYISNCLLLEYYRVPWVLLVVVGGGVML
jgi:hypothetical protein